MSEHPQDCKGAPASSAAHAHVSISSSDDEKSSFSIKQDLFDALIANGFGENAIKKSIVAGCVDAGTCTQWITMHQGHPDLDTPLEPGVEVVIKAKRILTEAERDAKVIEMQTRIKEKKEEEKREAHQKELDRIAMGRKNIETREKMEEIKRELDQEAARRERNANAEARKRVKIQIIADKYVRQGKPSDEAWSLAVKEYEESLEAARQQASNVLQGLLGSSQPATISTQWDLGAVVDSATAIGDRVEALFTAPQPTEEDLPALVASIHDTNDASERDQCLQTLRTILSNICEHPLDIKKRTFRTSTVAFSKRLLPVDGSVGVLRVCNFDLSSDAEGNHALVCTTVVMRVVRHALSLLSA